MGVAAAVYLIGGCVYQRTVMHARGWRQIPHWQVWAGVAGFIWVRLVLPLPLFLMRLVCGRRRMVRDVERVKDNEVWD
jgi:hypothetical protein